MRSDDICTHFGTLHPRPHIQRTSESFRLVLGTDRVPKVHDRWLPSTPHQGPFRIGVQAGCANTLDIYVLVLLETAQS